MSQSPDVPHAVMWILDHLTDPDINEEHPLLRSKVFELCSYCLSSDCSKVTKWVWVEQPFEVMHDLFAKYDGCKTQCMIKFFNNPLIISKFLEIGGR